MCLPLQGGTVVNADRQALHDVLIVGDKIAEVGPNLKVPLLRHCRAMHPY